MGSSLKHFVRKFVQQRINLEAKRCIQSTPAAIKAVKPATCEPDKKFKCKSFCNHIVLLSPVLYVIRSSAFTFVLWRNLWNIAEHCPLIWAGEELSPKAPLRDSEQNWTSDSDRADKAQLNRVVRKFPSSVMQVYYCFMFLHITRYIGIYVRAPHSVSHKKHPFAFPSRTLYCSLI